MGDRSEFDQHRREYPLCSRHGRSAGEALAKFTLRVDPRKRPKPLCVLPMSSWRFSPYSSGHWPLTARNLISLGLRTVHHLPPILS